ncbi:MAG: hypothetical protein M1299_01985, partial [Firmicutes bacterium]|nr:hypothetical protein [Bacillota bacterium]
MFFRPVCHLPLLTRLLPQRFLPSQVRVVLGRLEEAGYPAYAVGGAVRDLLLGQRPHDWDVATAALPEVVMDLFPSTYPT